MAYLEVKNIKKNFGELCVLKDINFTLEKGEVLAIIGSSGSGKTTLLRCLNFLENADSGQIYIDSKMLYDAKEAVNISEDGFRQMRLNFGLVFQSFNLFPQYNVLQNIVLAPNLLDKSAFKVQKRALIKEMFARKISRTEAKEKLAKLKEESKNRKDNNVAKAKAILHRVGLDDKVLSYPCELSGGQSQRVAIARALALDPNVLCFDEPTSALDPELTGEVLRVIKGLKSSDSTMIVVTHEMEFARNVADKVIFMADGVIEETGTPSEVFDTPKSNKTKAFLQKAQENITGEYDGKD